MKPFAFISFIVLITSMIYTVYAQELKPSNLFSNHMVLQSGMEVPVWGDAKPNEKITVTFANQEKSTITDAKGKWMVKLEPLGVSKIGRSMSISGHSKITLSDILVGEVWICSGQSNMEFKVDNVPEIKSLKPIPNHIRSFEVKHTVSFEEAQDVNGHWSTSPSTSAVAFGFAFFLETLGDVPVGIINTSWGSTSIEAWMPRDMTEQLPYFKTIMSEFDSDTLTQNKIQKALDASNGWSKEEDVFLRRQPNIVYNAMMSPLAPYACKGLVWYQGERNTRYLSGMPEVTETNWFHRVAGMKEYGDILKFWVERYRTQWNNEYMHFSIVMLPGYGKGTYNSPEIDSKSPTAPSWAWMRESQLKILELPYTTVVNTIDLGDEKNIHPTDKLPIAQRLALKAAKYTLNKDVIAEGPTFKTLKKENNVMVVKFNQAKGLKTKDNKAPTGFWIADESLQWKPAIAKIQDETILLSHDKITQPKYVRYAFSGKPDVNLVNGENLPAYPFRTDSDYSTK
ncbi:putative carbohydrate esterase (CE6) [Formosa agariphila KMM 3901]|uniref:Putative carbohydrate esterase (CE6) n=1 Tax=Formosa agariphila (strain DSM 15362 / KCTC 12365 / LMG 23005 / KMM 3901 / M-2Alg 35-1) TaxID=1347342 RepID=T2KKF3_FORAG|nr:sialate O-acetylesterase [Formosa agariphila]CDF78489.1 putative carbohydrate esterase (CE6) [Formosa agariphila KMM 3901]